MVKCKRIYHYKAFYNRISSLYIVIIKEKGWCWMNWIENMNKALEYIEKNIEKNITSDEIARIAYASKFHFMRTFSMLTGMTLGEYIRQRRLSLAAKDIMSSNKKIIEIAYKYRYETPEAFTKAFKKLHNISPSEARKKEESQSYSSNILSNNS